MKKYFTSESVTEGHPDKICDQISDAVLDAIIKEDPMARVACETCVTTGMVLIMGEITTNCYVEIPKIARDLLKESVTTELNTVLTAQHAPYLQLSTNSPQTSQWALTETVQATRV